MKLFLKNKDFSLASDCIFIRGAYMSYCSCIVMVQEQSGRDFHERNEGRPEKGAKSAQSAA